MGKLDKITHRLRTLLLYPERSIKGEVYDKLFFMFAPILIDPTILEITQLLYKLRNPLLLVALFNKLQNHYPSKYPIPPIVHTLLLDLLVIKLSIIDTKYLELLTNYTLKDYSFHRLEMRLKNVLITQDLENLEFDVIASPFK